MSDDIDELIRRAHGRLADRAVPADQIRAALPAAAAARRARRRTVLAVVVAAVVVAAVAGVPAIVLHRGPTPVQSAGGAGVAVPLRFRPTWLPAGLTEDRRSFGTPRGNAVPSNQLRVWAPSGSSGIAGDAWLSLTLYDSGDPGFSATSYPDTSPGESVTVNGAPGRYVGGTGTHRVMWRPDADTLLNLAASQTLNLSKETMLKIAESVRPDPTTMRLPVAFGWLPVGMAQFNASLDGTSPHRWTAAAAADRRDGQAPSGAATGPYSDVTFELDFYAGPTPADPPWPMVAPGGTPLTVAGHPAKLFPEPPPGGRRDPNTSAAVLVTIDPGLHLVLIAGSPADHPLARADLVKVAQSLIIDSHPDTAWIDTR